MNGQEEPSRLALTCDRLARTKSTTPSFGNLYFQCCKFVLLQCSLRKKLRLMRFEPQGRTEDEDCGSTFSYDRIVHGI